jgi:hypothetical protein
MLTSVPSEAISSAMDRPIPLGPPRIAKNLPSIMKPIGKKVG